MPDAVIYEGWDLTHAPWPLHSYLYSLPPLGVGTAGVESLTGYIARLAAAHAVEAGALISRELSPQVPCTKGSSEGLAPLVLHGSFYRRSYSLNGTGERAALWAAILERFTCVDRLDLLTALPWTKAINCVHLVRKRRAWCPCCYGAEPGDGTAYERLSWALQVVTVCPEHGRPLETVCPFCQKELLVLSAKSRPGHCSRCHSWLGGTPQRVGTASEAIRVAEMVGAMLAASPSLSAGFGLDQFQENVRHLSDRGRLSSPALRHRNIRGWMRRGNAPRMDSLAHLSQDLGVSMLALVTEKIEVDDSGSSPHAHYRVAHAAMEAALRRALQDGFPCSLEDVARIIGYRSVASLRVRFPDLCQQVVTRRRAWLESHGPPNPPVPLERIEQALGEALSQEGPVPLKAIAAKIGLRNRRRLYKIRRLQDLRRAVVEKNKRLWQQAADAIENAIRAAFNETPIPTLTELARRLGLKDVNRIIRRFPELAESLRQQRLQSAHVVLCTQGTQHGD